MIKFKFVLAAAALFLIGCFVGYTWGRLYFTLPRESDPVLALVNGTPVHQSHVLKQAGEEIKGLQQSIYQIQKRVILDLAVKGRTIVAQPKNTRISDQEIQAFAARYKLHPAKLSEKERKNLIENFKMHKKMQRQHQEREDILSKLNFQWFLPMPFLEPPTDLSPGPWAPLIKGRGEHKIMAWANFHCPDCRALAKLIENARESKHHPVTLILRFAGLEAVDSLPFQSMMAAACSEKQGRFTEMVESLSRNPPQQFEELQLRAQKMDLDSAAFEKCLRDPSIKDLVVKDLRESQKQELGSVGAIFVNGHRLSLQESWDWIENVLNQKN